MNNKFYVYLLKSLKNNRYYIGYTQNINNRLAEHNSGKVKYTSLNKPFNLIGFETYQSENEARWRERTLKKSAWKRTQFIKKFAPIAQSDRATAF